MPHGHWKIATFVVGLRADGIVAPLVFDGPDQASPSTKLLITAVHAGAGVTAR